MTAEVVMALWADWLVALGYPYDIITDRPIPDEMIEPLARAWAHHDDALNELGLYMASIYDEIAHHRAQPGGG